SDEAVELTLSALHAVLKENVRIELLIRKLRASKAGKSGSEKLDAEQLSLLLELLQAETGEDEGADEAPDVESELVADAALDAEIEQAEDEAAEDKPKDKRKRNKAL